MAGLTYGDRGYWRRYQEFFPTALRITGDNAPAEEWWSSHAGRIHLDRVARPQARAKLLVLHGVGTYGRMFTPFGRLPGFSEYEFLAPDLPGFGLSRERHDRCAPADYTRWVECLRLLVRAERADDPRPIVLFGLSTGGRLAYDLAAAGWELVYVDAVHAHHHPAEHRRDDSRRGDVEWRNNLLIDWMRRPLSTATKRTAGLLGNAWRDPRARRVAVATLGKLPTALRRRAVLPAAVERRVGLVEQEHGH